MAFYELKSKINSLEEELKQAKDENLRLIDERQKAETNESKYRKKYDRAKENLTKMTKRSGEIQKELLLVNAEHDKLKQEFSNLEEDYASDLERCDKTIKTLKQKLYEAGKKLKTYVQIDRAIEQNKMMLESYRVQLAEKKKTDKLRETLLRVNFQNQIRDALLMGQEQGRAAERMRQKKKDQETWKKLKTLEDEELMMEKEARMSAAHVVASELNGHIDSSALRQTKGGHNWGLRMNSNPSNAIFYMDKFNERMEIANKLLHKPSKDASRKGRIDAEHTDTEKDFASIVSRLKNMNTIYATHQKLHQPEEKKMTFKEIQ